MICRANCQFFNKLFIEEYYRMLKKCDTLATLNCNRVEHLDFRNFQTLAAECLNCSSGLYDANVQRLMVIQGQGSFLFVTKSKLCYPFSCPAPSILAFPYSCYSAIFFAVFNCPVPAILALQILRALF